MDSSCCHVGPSPRQGVSPFTSRHEGKLRGYPFWKLPHTEASDGVAITDVDRTTFLHGLRSYLADFVKALRPSREPVLALIPISGFGCSEPKEIWPGPFLLAMITGCLA